MTVAYSIVPILWKKDKIPIISVMEMSFGLGTLIGPPIGSMIYGKLGFQMNFYIWAVFVLFVTFLTSNTLPDNLNFEKSE